MGGVFFERLLFSTYQYEFEVDTNSITLEANGQAQALTVISRKVWSNGETEDVLFTAKIYGNVFKYSNGAVSASNNTDIYSRYDTLTLTQLESGEVIVIDLTQKPGKEIYENPVILQFSYPEHSADSATILPSIIGEQIFTWNGVPGSGGKIYFADYSLSAHELEAWIRVGEEYGSVNPDTAALTWNSNTSDVARQITVVAKVTLNGLSSEEYSTIATQNADVVVSYKDDLTINSFVVDDIPASGGEIKYGTITYSQTAVLQSGATAIITEGALVTYSIPVTADNLNTTVTPRTKKGTLTATVTLNGSTVSKTIDVYQEANEIVDYGDIITGEMQVEDIPANGGSISEAVLNNWSQIISYTSRKTRYGDISYSYNTVEAYDLTTNLSDRKVVGTLTVTARGEGSKTASRSVSVYQAANTRTLTSIYFTPYQPDNTWIGIIKDSDKDAIWNNVPAKGGYILAKGYHVYTYSSTETKDEIQTNDAELEFTGNISISKHRNGYHIESRGTVIGDVIQSQVQWTSEGFTSVKTLTQDANIVTNISVNENVFSYSNINAGDTIAHPISTDVPLFTYSSTATSTETPDKEFGRLDTFISYKLSSAINGFTSLDVNTGELTATNRGTELTTNQTSGIVTKSLQYAWIPKTLGLQLISGTNLKTATCTQNGNKVETLSIHVSDESKEHYVYYKDTAKASGEVINPVLNYNTTLIFSSGASLVNEVPDNANISFTPTYSGSTTGASVNSSTGQVTWSDNQSFNPRSVNVQVQSKFIYSDTIHNTPITVNDTFTIQCLQVAGHYSYSTPVVEFSYPNAQAIGGVYSPTLNVSQKYGWNDSSTNAGTITSYDSISFAINDGDAISGLALNANTGVITWENNTSSSQKVETIRVFGTMSTTGHSFEKTTNATQDAGTVTYIITPSVTNVGSLSASGQTVTSTITYSESWNGTITSTNNPLSGYTITETKDTLGLVSATGTSGTITIKSQNNLDTITGEFNYTISKNGYQSAQIYGTVNAGECVYGPIEITSFTYGAVGANGGTSSPSISYSQVCTWNGGVSDTIIGNGDDGYITYAETTAHSALNVNSSTGIVTWTKNNATSGSVDASRSGVITATVSRNGKTATKTATTVQNAEQISSYGDWTFTLTPNKTNFTATGGTATFTLSRPTRTITYDTGDTQIETATSGSFALTSSNSEFTLSKSSISMTSSSLPTFTLTVPATGAKEVNATSGSVTAVFTATNPITGSARATVESESIIRAKSELISTEYQFSTFSLSKSSFTAAGGNSKLSMVVQQRNEYTGSQTSSWTTVNPQSGSISVTVSGNANVGTITYGSTSTCNITVKPNKYVSSNTITITATYGTNLASSTASISQSADTISGYGAVTISCGTIDDIPACGGTVTTSATATQIVYWVSGDETTENVAVIQDSFSYESSCSETRENVGTVTAVANGNDGYSDECELDVYQEATTLTASYGTWSKWSNNGTVSVVDTELTDCEIDANCPDDISAAGGKVRASATCTYYWTDTMETPQKRSRTVTYKNSCGDVCSTTTEWGYRTNTTYNEYTSTDTVYGNYVQGSDLAKKETDRKFRGTSTVTCDGGCSYECDVYQEANTYTTSNGSWTETSRTQKSKTESGRTTSVTSVDVTKDSEPDYIPASGGTVYLTGKATVSYKDTVTYKCYDTVSYTRTCTDTYTSGDTNERTETKTETSSAYTATDYEYYEKEVPLSDSVSAESLGCELKTSATKIGTLRIEYSEGGKSDYATATVYQATNRAVDSNKSYDCEPIVVGTITDGWVPASGGTGTATITDGTQWVVTNTETTYESGLSCLSATREQKVAKASQNTWSKTGSNLTTNETDEKSLGGVTIVWRSNDCSDTNTGYYYAYVYQEANKKLPGTYEFSVSETSLSFDHSAFDGQIVDVDSSYSGEYTSGSEYNDAINWTVSSDATWCSVSKSGTSIYISGISNTKGFSRTATITVTQNSSGKTKTITVTQSAAPVAPPVVTDACPICGADAWQDGVCTVCGHTK